MLLRRPAPSVRFTSRCFLFLLFVLTDAVRDVTEYIPDALVPQYESLRNLALGWLGSAPDSSSPTSSSAGKLQLSVIMPFRAYSLIQSLDTTKLREALSQAEKDLANSKKEHDNAKQDLDELFDPKFFGSQGEWRQPTNKCFSKDTGECVYFGILAGV